VLTYPAFRKQGYGLHLVQSAKAFIEQQVEADLVLFHSTLKGFYEQADFERIDSLVTLVGDPRRPERSPETAFMFFLSDKGKRGRSGFEDASVYVGESIW
jgi:N-acetylglutamate synthase-like GNAT family acetyltransferase